MRNIAALGKSRWRFAVSDAKHRTACFLCYAGIMVRKSSRLENQVLSVILPRKDVYYTLYELAIVPPHHVIVGDGEEMILIHPEEAANKW